MRRLPLVLMLLMALIACNQTPDQPESVVTQTSLPAAELLPSPTPIATEVPLPELSGLPPIVSSFELSFTQSSPPGVIVQIFGTFPNDCTEIAAINQGRTEMGYALAMTTQPVAGATCSDSETPFETEVNLDIGDIPAGDYRLDVNNFNGTFYYPGVEMVIPEGTTLLTEITPVQIVAVDGLELAATFFPAEQQAVLPAVLIIHGAEGRGSDLEPYARRLRESGFSALIVDMRGHGDSGGRINWSLSIDDAVRALDWLAQQPNVDPAQVSVIGADVGGNVGLLAGARRPEVRSAVLMSPGLDYEGLDGREAVRGFGDRPVLMVTSQGDSFSLNSANLMINLAQSEQSALIIAEGDAHGSQLLEIDPFLGIRLTQWMTEPSATPWGGSLAATV